MPAGETPAAPLGELTTPTGAALLAHYAEAFGGVPAGRVERVGYGAGRREVPGRPNVLRAVLVDPAVVAGGGGGRSGRRSRCGCGVPRRPRPRRPRRPRGQHRRHDAGTAGARRQRAARVRRARRVDEPGAHEEGPPRRGPARARRRRPTASASRGASSPRRLDLRPARRAVSTASTSRSGARRVKIGKLKVSVRLGFVDGRLATVSPEYEDVRRVAAAVGRPARGRLRGRAVGRAQPVQRLLSARRGRPSAGRPRPPAPHPRSVRPPGQLVLEIDRFCAAPVESRTRRRISPPVTVRRPHHARRAG